MKFSKKMNKKIIIKNPTNKNQQLIKILVLCIRIYKNNNKFHHRILKKLPTK